MTITLEQFINNNKGKQLANPDGTYVGQCVSLVQQYLSQCFDIPFRARGNAKDWLTSSTDIMQLMVEGTIPNAGDIIVFPDGGGGYGHIAVAYNASTIFEQNAYPSYVAQLRLLSDANKTAGYHRVLRLYQLMNSSGGSVTPTPVSKLKMILDSSAARLRDNFVNGNTKTLIAKGQTFEVINLYNWKATDGYRWGWGKYGNVEGYFQYDPAVMHLEGTVSDKNFKMVLTGSAARIRNSVRGSVLATVSNGGVIKITEFITGKQSDGYYWCKGVYNGVTGYFQYDPAVMYPTDSI